MSSWWARKIRQTFRYATGRVSADERREVAELLTPSQLALFDSMHPADQRHGLDVVRSLRAAGRTEHDLLLAGLFHDAGKGSSTGLASRVAWSLSDRYGGWVRPLARVLPGVGAGLERMDGHAQRSAELALAAGCSALTADLIRNQASPRDARLGAALLAADEAN